MRGHVYSSVTLLLALLPALLPALFSTLKVTFRRCETVIFMSTFNFQNPENQTENTQPSKMEMQHLFSHQNAALT